MIANNTSISGGTDNHDSISMEFRIVKITLYVIIFTLSCIGNSLVAIVIIGARGMRTHSNLLILNLALCDLVTPVLSIPFDLALEELHNVWPFGRVMCKLVWPFETMFSTSSSLTLAVISLDRFRALVKPLHERPSIIQVFKIVVGIHVFSISLCIPYFIALQYSDSTKSCTESWSTVGYRQAYTIVLFLFQLGIPLVTMTVAYFLIYRSLRSNTIRLFSSDTCKQRRRPISKISYLSKDESELKRREQNIHLAKMFTIVVVVFAISMSPNQFFWLWVDFGQGEDNRFFNYISATCRLFTYANSVLNPFIYALKSKEFRSGFARIGRASMQPLRKISRDTRKFVVKRVSGNSTQAPMSEAGAIHASTPSQNDAVCNDGTNCLSGTKGQDKNSVGNMNPLLDVSFLEKLSEPGSHHLFQELRESTC